MNGNRIFLSELVNTEDIHHHCFGDRKLEFSLKLVHLMWQGTDWPGVIMLAAKRDGIQQLIKFLYKTDATQTIRQTRQRQTDRQTDRLANLMEYSCGHSHTSTQSRLFTDMPYSPNTCEVLGK